MTLDELKAHQKTRHHEFLEWVDPPAQASQTDQRQKRHEYEYHSDISSLGELELVETQPQSANSQWIKFMQQAELHSRSLLLYSMSEQAQQIYLPNRVYVVDLISKICADRNCSKWVFFNTVNMLDIFVARTVLKLDAGFRTWAEVCVFISQKLYQKMVFDFSKPPNPNWPIKDLVSKIHTSSALETTILQTVEGLAPEHNLSSWIAVLTSSWDGFAKSHSQIKHDVDRHKILFRLKNQQTGL